MENDIDLEKKKSKHKSLAIGLGVLSAIYAGFFAKGLIDLKETGSMSWSLIVNGLLVFYFAYIAFLNRSAYERMDSLENLENLEEIVTERVKKNK